MIMGCRTARLTRLMWCLRVQNSGGVSSQVVIGCMRGRCTKVSMIPILLAMSTIIPPADACGIPG